MRTSIPICMAALAVLLACHEQPEANVPCAGVPTPPLATRPVTPNESQPARVVFAAPTAADLLPLALEPERLSAMVDPERGVLVLRSLDCEREDEIATVQHACGDSAADALAPVLPGVRQQVIAALQYPEESGIECTRSGDATMCTLAPHSECEPTYQLRFGSAGLLAVVERDDWQGTDEGRAPTDERFDSELGRSRRCPSTHVQSE